MAMKPHGSRSMSGKVTLWTGLAALLLAGAPGKAQDGCEDCHGEFPVMIPKYADDLGPVSGVFGGPEALLRERFVASELDRHLPPVSWRIKTIGVSADADLPDFAVVLHTPISGGSTKANIVGVSLAVPSYLYEFLYDARAPHRWDSILLDFEARADFARKMSLARYGDTQPDPADNEAEARAKARINARLAKSSVTKCEAVMDNRLADRAHEIMRRTLARTHYSEGSELISFTDGMKTQYDPFTFYFLAGYQGGAGNTQAVGTRPALMIRAAMAMRDFCMTSDRKYLAALTQALDGLEKKLPKQK